VFWIAFFGLGFIAARLSIVFNFLQHWRAACIGLMYQRALGDKGEFGVGPPDRTEVVGHLLGERGHHRHDLTIGQHDHRNLDGWGLCVRGLGHTSGLLSKRSSENAPREFA
jgi:hypothetical protein